MGLFSHTVGTTSKQPRAAREKIVVHAKTLYLVEAEEAKLADHVDCADPRPGGDLACHLQANLHNLQRVGEDHLRAAGLEEWGQGELDHAAH